MATTTPDGITTPDSGTDYDLTVDLGIMADTVQDALTRRANYGLGTTTQMNAALSQFSNGAVWYNTTTSSEWRRVSGAWVNQASSHPFRMAAGVINISTSSSVTASGTVTFPAGRFTQTPIVTTGSNGNSQYFVSMTSPTSTDVLLTIRHSGGASASSTVAVNWTAVQMTSSSAAG